MSSSGVAGPIGCELLNALVRSLDDECSSYEETKADSRPGEFSLVRNDCGRNYRELFAGRSTTSRLC